MKNYLMCIFLAVFTISIYGQNHKNAADYRTDAINGNAIAQFYLGQSYFRGWGIKPDTIQAVYWWRKSAEQGDPTAQNNMGVAYSNGWGNLIVADYGRRPGFSIREIPGDIECKCFCALRSYHFFYG